MALKSGGLRGSLRHISTGVGDAIPDSAVDNFEATLYEDQGNTLSDYYSGDLASFTRDQNTVLEGSYTLFAENHSQGDFIYSVDGDGLPRYPQQGEEFSVLCRPGVNAQAEVAFATPSTNQSPTNLGYCVRFSSNDDRIELNKRVGGFTNLATDTGASITAGNDYEAVIEWHDGSGSEANNTIVVTVYDWDPSSGRGSQQGQVSATDSDGAGNVGIGLIEGGTNTPDNRFDRYRVLGGVP